MLLNCSTKYFLLFLFLCIFKPACAMHFTNKNKFETTIKKALAKITEKKWKKIQKDLNKCFKRDSININDFFFIPPNDISSYLNDKFPETALAYVINYRNVEINNMRYLKERKVNCSLTTPLSDDRNLIYYLLEQKADPNVKHKYANTLIQTLLHQEERPSANEIIKKLLEFNADPNGESKSGTNIVTAIRKKNNTAIELLLTHKANINTPDSFSAVLSFGSNELIKKLCRNGILNFKLNFEGENIFHMAMKKICPKKGIEKVIKHACFDPYNEEANKNLETTIRLCLRIFIRLNSLGELPVIPRELQFHIFSYLIESNSLAGFAGKLAKQAVKAGYNIPILEHTNNRILNIQNLLQAKNKYNNTPLEVLDYNFAVDSVAKEEIRFLLENKFPSDITKFDKALENNSLDKLPKDNLKYRIYLNSKQYY